ncbi:hypothetical protein G6514_000357 [Epicoccum nigrum]|nr:hypothetical protein G6514_000357 [Epicoccum nigrum]
MKDEPHNDDEHRRGSDEPPQKRRREDSESQPPASAGRPNIHTSNVIQQVVLQNQVMTATRNGTVMATHSPSQQNLMDALRARDIFLSKNVNRLKNQVRQHLEAADVQAEKIEKLETQAETFILRSQRSAGEIVTLQAKVNTLEKERDQNVRLMQAQ